MKTESEAPKTPTPTQTHAQTSYTAQWGTAHIPIDPALQQQSQHATSSCLFVPLHSGTQYIHLIQNNSIFLPVHPPLSSSCLFALFICPTTTTSTKAAGHDDSSCNSSNHPARKCE
ncbi:hypothetical protein BDR04DRAFT_711293 [Suillus decipiens]|nr:hypothetical protein BDR04DRAFT_711293 [Suillus decipiens]